jgi:hypothetical protein
LPQISLDDIPAHWSIRAMDDLTKMLGSRKMDWGLSEIEDYEGTTLGDLLAFMHAFKLRFGKAKPYRQLATYQNLYPMGAEQANLSLGSEACDVAAGISNNAGTVEKAGDRAVQAVGGAAGQVSKDVEGLVAMRSIL